MAEHRCSRRGCCYCNGGFRAAHVLPIAVVEKESEETATGMTEAQVQKQIVDGLRANRAYVIVTHDSKHRPIHQGITDIIAVLSDRVMFIECKAPGGKVSEYQREFIASMRALGHDAFVADCWDDVERQL